ncbi:MAG: large conductance mechanosensitive channel protein MscL [Candidatus Gallimonas sp.]
MSKKKKEKKGFFQEFKAFVTRGNVLDMAVGIIVGGAFTAIITALVNNILTPLLQMIPGTGADGFGALQVVLKNAVLDEQGNVLQAAVVLDFGVVISAIITFLLTALVLFTIIKVINGIHQRAKKAKEEYEAKKAAEEAKETKAEEPAETPAEPAPAPAPAPTTEELLAEIRDLLKAQQSVVETEKQEKKKD